MLLVTFSSIKQVMNLWLDFLNDIVEVIAQGRHLCSMSEFVLVSWRKIEVERMRARLCSTPVVE